MSSLPWTQDVQILVQWLTFACFFFKSETQKLHIVAQCMYLFPFIKINVKPVFMTTKLFIISDDTLQTYLAGEGNVKKLICAFLTSKAKISVSLISRYSNIVRWNNLWSSLDVKMMHRRS